VTDASATAIAATTSAVTVSTGKYQNLVQLGIARLPGQRELRSPSTAQPMWSSWGTLKATSSIVMVFPEPAPVPRPVFMIILFLNTTSLETGCGRSNWVHPEKARMGEVS